MFSYHTTVSTPELWKTAQLLLRWRQDDDDSSIFTVGTSHYHVSWYHSDSASGCWAIGCVAQLSSAHASAAPVAILLASLAIENESPAFLFMAVPRGAPAPPRPAPPRPPAPRPRPRRGLVKPDIMPPREPPPRPPRMPMPRLRPYKQQTNKMSTHFRLIHKQFCGSYSTNIDLYSALSQMPLMHCVH